MSTAPIVAPHLADIAAKLQDPAVVHAAMLRGEIAKPDIRDMLHAYGADALARWDAGAPPANTEKAPSILCYCGAMDRFTFGGELKPWACTKPGCSALAPDAQPAPDAVPVATIHDDGYWTHKPGRDPLGQFSGKSRMDVYAAPVSQQAEPDLVWAGCDKGLVPRGTPAAQQAEPMARFCPGCGSVGQVPDTYRDCCPDGIRARVIPAALAQQCHDLFALALDAAVHPAEPHNVPREWRSVLRQLVFMARTSGGTAGPDRGLMEALLKAEKLLSEPYLPAAAHPQQTAPQPLTNDLLERHAVAASDCPPGSEVVLVSSLRRLGIASPVGHYTPEKLREAAAREVAP